VMVIAGERFAPECRNLCFVDLGLTHGRDHAAEDGEEAGVQSRELHAHVRVFQLRGAHGPPQTILQPSYDFQFSNSSPLASAACSSIRCRLSGSLIL
jgi:hypothetical protein